MVIASDTVKVVVYYNYLDYTHSALLDDKVNETFT